MIFKNFNQLGTSVLKKQALIIADAGLQAVETSAVMASHVKFDSKTSQLFVMNKKFNLKEFEKIFLVGFGKVSLKATDYLASLLSGYITSGHIIDVSSGHIPGIEVTSGTHPLPSKHNVHATMQIMDLVKNAGEKDLILCIVSGGGSSLFVAPANNTIEEERAIIKALMDAGAEIHELNIVRKHMSLGKGGQLAKLAFPSTMINFIFSDVPGDDLGSIASGPTVFDTSTMHDAAMILQKYKILETCKMDSCGLTETPKEKYIFEKVNNFLVCSGSVALEAMSKKAYDLGFSPKIWDEKFSGEAKTLGKVIPGLTGKGECLLGSGESTVTIEPGKKGYGGRNMELALASLKYLPDDCVLASIASDGHDNCDKAGGIAAADLLGTIKNRGYDLEMALEYHNEYDLMTDCNAALDTGLTGINISDLVVCLRQ